MQFVVPQFIEVESKIIGPISARQFVISLITIGLCFVWYSVFSLIIFIPLLFISASLGGLLAFGKVNGQAMHYVLLNLIQTLRRPRLKIWHRILYTEEYTTTQQVPTHGQSIKKEISESRLAAMSLMVDTGGRYAPDDILSTHHEDDAINHNLSNASVSISATNRSRGRGYVERGRNPLNNQR